MSKRANIQFTSGTTLAVEGNAASIAKTLKANGDSPVDVELVGGDVAYVFGANVEAVIDLGEADPDVPDSVVDWTDAQ